MTAAVITARCQGCGACLLTCPEHAIRPAPRLPAPGLAVLDELCTGCGECVEVCPVDAVLLPDELLPVKPEVGT
ncbi:MAG TPA: 4Fe-4S binding protein [Streptosporangiaceae bacterium]|nr:4Fe-4S binding protein [Streptosporangiaceae bacterium]